MTGVLAATEEHLLFMVKIVVKKALFVDAIVGVGQMEWSTSAERRRLKHGSMLRHWVKLH